MRNRGKRGIVGIRKVMPMPLNPKAKARTKEEKYGYDQDYLKQNVVQIGVTFNRRKKDDMELLEWLNGRAESRVSYIKRLIREDMEKGGK